VVKIRLRDKDEPVRLTAYAVSKRVDPTDEDRIPYNHFEVVESRKMTAEKAGAAMRALSLQYPSTHHFLVDEDDPEKPGAWAGQFAPKKG
jgi:hypothetical protein